MRKITTTIAVALAAGLVPATADAATYIGFGSAAERPAGYAGATVLPSTANELLGYAVATIEAFPNMDALIGQPLSPVRAGRAGRTSSGDDERYLFNFRIPADARLTRPSARGVGPQSTSLALVPEPAVWTMLILGFGLVAGMQRRRQTQRALI
jgi:hypothetical protein